MAARLSWSTKITLGLAFGLAALVWFTTGDQPNVTERALLTIALVFVSRDPLEAAALGLRRSPGLRVLRDLRFYAFLWLSAAQLATLLAIFMWQGPALDLRVLALGAGIGVLIGASQALMPASEPNGPSRFDLTRPADGTLLGRILTYIWPMAVTALIILVIVDPPDGGWQGVYPLFQMILLCFLMLFYPFAGPFKHTWPDQVPRIAGYALMIVALLMA